MTDIFDRASIAEQRQRDIALACALDHEKPNAITLCEWCGEPIGEARKRAVPSARLCIDCQSEKELR